MNKEQLFNDLKRMIQEGEVTQEELKALYTDTMQTEAQDLAVKQSRISNILYYIGGGIVFLGIWIFIATNWGSLNDFTRIFATLGSAVMMHVAGVLISQSGRLEKVGDAFFFIAQLVAPVGIFITMDIFGVDMTGAGSHSFVAAVLLGISVLSYWIHKRDVFYLFSIIFGTWLFFALSTFLIGGRPFEDWDYVKYRWLAAGLSYMSLGYALKGTDKKKFTPALNGFGVLAFLTAALSLGGWEPHQSLIWELIFPGIAFGVIFLSVYLKSKAYLVFGTLYLMVYILKITGEYFASGFGWALSLILVGFSLIGLGYAAFYLNQKYLKP